MLVMRDWIGNRLKDLKKTKAALAEHLGVAPARITELSHGKRSLQSHEIIPFAKFLQMEPIHVLHLLDNPNADVQPNQPIDLSPTKDQFTTIPIRGEVAAGLWREVDNLNQDMESFGFADTVVIPQYPPELQFGLIVRGESLNKIAPNGATLHCLEFISGGAWDVQDGDLVIVQRTKYQGALYEMTAKRVRKNGDFELWPESNHPDFQEPLKVQDIKDDSCDEEVRILAKVLKILIDP